MIGVCPSEVAFDDVGLFAGGDGGEYDAMMEDICDDEGLSSWVIWSRMSENELGVT